MSVDIIIGAQWGDEGKGKIVDLLSEKADYVVRSQGGSNAGHTVKIDNNKYILHMVPSGVLHPSTISIIGNGVVFDYKSFLKEIQTLKDQGIELQNRLFVSQFAHVILPFHPQIDIAKENCRKNKIGTTAKGIGPCYKDKVVRTGIRVCDIVDDPDFPQKLKQVVDIQNKEFLGLYGEENKFSYESILKDIMNDFEIIKPYVTDTSLMLDKAIKNNKNILFEGAQGTLLDIDHGTYPFVTSSNTTSGGACTGSGIGPTHINNVIGIMKAYVTRVGNGPFVTELFDDNGKLLEKVGAEFGATTGRRRRCGYFDMLIAKYAVRINGITEIILTKLDVLSALKTIKVCVAYKYKNQIIENFNPAPFILDQAQPVYEEFPSWKEDISEIRNFEDLPENAKKYISYLEKGMGVKISWISVGAKRSQSIKK